MDKSRQQLQTSISRYFQETEASIEPFLAEIVARYVILSCYQDISKSAEISQNDQASLLEIAVSILQLADENITGHSVRAAGAGMSEFVQFRDLTNECLGRPAQLSQSCFKQIYSVYNQDVVYGALEQLLIQIYRPLALETNNTQLAYSLKIALNSILPRTDVLVFRDMLVKETSADKPNQSISSAQKQLLELADVTAGVALIGEPPAQALQSVEQNLVVLVKEVEIQFNMQLGVYVSSVLPLLIHENDTGSAVDPSKSARLRQLFMYALNRVVLIQSISYLLNEILRIYDKFRSTAAEFKDQIQSIQQLLQEKESIPKAQIYPKFQHIAQLYQSIQVISEQFVRLRTWHARVSAYAEDRQFSPLPDATAKMPFFTSEELAEARAWFVKQYGREANRTESSRFMRLCVQILGEKQSAGYSGGNAGGSATQVAQSANAVSAATSANFRDLSYFKALSAEEITSCDCLFGGVDLVLLTGPQNARNGIVAFGNALFAQWDLKTLSEKIVINSAKLGFVDNKTAREGPPTSTTGANMTTLMGPRGPELLSFSCPQSRDLFVQNPAIFIAAALAAAFSSPDYLPLIFLLDVPRVARFAASQQFRDCREAFSTRFSTQFVDPLPCVRAQVISDEPCQNGVEALLFKNQGGRRLQVDNCGYLRRPLYADLYNKYLVARLAESDVSAAQEVNVLASGFSADQFMSQELLSTIAELGASDVYKKFSIARRELFRITSESLLSQEERAVVEEQIRQNGGAEFVNMVDAEAQTPLHFYDSRIVPGYTSSEWELRARALRLFQIQKKRTKEAQTEQTNSKASSAFQTVQTHDSETQSKHDAFTTEVVVQQYTKRPYQSMSYASQVLRDAGQTMLTTQAQLKIDFDAIKKGADAYRQLREAAASE